MIDFLDIMGVDRTRWLAGVFLLISVVTELVLGQAYPPTTTSRASSSSSELRLANGDYEYTYGRLEIRINGTWGTVCDDSFDESDATVACRQLGLDTDTVGVYESAHFGSGIGTIWLDEVQCYGWEGALIDCLHDGLGVNDCSHSEDVGISCGTKNYDLRLVNGGVDYGRVEIYYNGVWGTVCDDAFGFIDAQVVCRQLGFDTLTANYHPGAQFGQGMDPIVLDELQCSGIETKLINCPSNALLVNDCTHSEDVGVSCGSTPYTNNTTVVVTESSTYSSFGFYAIIVVFIVMAIVIAMCRRRRLRQQRMQRTVITTPTMVQTAMTPGTNGNQPVATYYHGVPQSDPQGQGVQPYPAAPHPGMTYPPPQAAGAPQQYPVQPYPAPGQPPAGAPYPPQGAPYAAQAGQPAPYPPHQMGQAAPYPTQQPGQAAPYPNQQPGPAGAPYPATQQPGQAAPYPPQQPVQAAAPYPYQQPGQAAPYPPQQGQPEPYPTKPVGQAPPQGDAPPMYPPAASAPPAEDIPPPPSYNDAVNH